MTGGNDNPDKGSQKRQRSGPRAADSKGGNQRQSEGTDPADNQAGSQTDDSAADNLRAPELGAFPEQNAQLPPASGVPQDMGTIALDRISGQGRRSGALPPSMAGNAVELNRLTDAEIMQQAGAGDDAALDFLIAKYRRPIVNFMYRMVHNQAIAEELAQEVFLRVYRARASYRAEAKFTTWLYRIAANMAINHARDTKYERASSSVYLDETDEDTGTKPDVADAHPLVEQEMLRAEQMRRIRKQVMALPERQRTAVVMHKFQDMDYKQIGEVLKLSESATKSLLFRAYQTLRERLKEFA
jgi:RNA polymerase sigma-70 factor, ECF subfamily